MLEALCTTAFSDTRSRRAMAALLRPSGIHASRPLARRGETWIALTFGLMHGLAFAALPGQLDLSRGALVTTLLGVNLGIELTQLIVVALIMPLADRAQPNPDLSDRPRDSRRVRGGPGIRLDRRALEHGQPRPFGVAAPRARKRPARRTHEPMPPGNMTISLTDPFMMSTLNHWVQATPVYASLLSPRQGPGPPDPDR